MKPQFLCVFLGVLAVAVSVSFKIGLASNLLAVFDSLTRIRSQTHLRAFLSLKDRIKQIHLSENID